MSIEALVRQSQTAEDEIDRAEAVEQLAKYESAIAWDAIIEALADRDMLVVIAAMSAIKRAKLNPVEKLIHALSDSREAMRWSAAELLATYPSDQVVKALSAALSDMSPHVRGEAARSLGELALSDEVISLLVATLDDSDTFPRYQALRTLHSIAPMLVDEKQILRNDLHAADPEKRRAAIHFIMDFDMRNWLLAVKRLVADPNLGVRKAAAAAIARLSADAQESP